MTFGQLAVICLAGVAGPLLAISHRWAVPVIVGELLVGICLGPMVLGQLDSTNPTFEFLAQIGFALVMFVVGSHVPFGDPDLRRALPVGLLQAAAVGVASVPIAVGLASAFGTGHAALYAVLLSSSSAALILPILDSMRLSGPATTRLLPQVAVADTVCIVALPLAIDPARALRAALGAVAVIGCSALLYVALRVAEQRGWRRSLHRLSEERKFALELRLNLAILFGLAAIAHATRISIMLAGFTFGMVVAAIGEPRRLARQLFAVTEGFFAPLFFVWLGASLDLKPLAERPSLIWLGVLLGLGAVAAHLVARVFRQGFALNALSAAQLGVPVAAAALGTQLHLLAAGEPAALILGALVTIVVASSAASWAARSALSARGVRPEHRGT